MATTSPTVRPALTRPPAVDLVWLGVAVLFISSSGPIIAATVAPALAIAFWRCFLGSAATTPWVLIRHRAELPRLTRHEWWLVGSAGVLLGAHFATWIPSLRFTTVASSTALVATQPVWAALIARRRGATMPRSAWIGIAISLVGVLILTGIDVSIDPRHLIGDGLALAGAVLAAAYVSVGEQARQTVSTATFTTGLYASAAALLLVLCVVGRQPLAGYSAQDWICILALTAGAQLLGHTLINKVLSTTSATFVSLAILLEMPGATIIAAVFLHQLPPWQIIPAVALMFAGIVLVIRAGSRDVPTESPPV
jgi:drug/metabolite transporter (DMT)-like permease